MGSISEEIKQSFKNGSVLVKLIYINLGVFLAINVLFVVFFLFVPGFSTVIDKRLYFESNYLTYLKIPSNPTQLFFRPWTLITYMFLHFDLLHILGNMLMLFWFGRIFLQYLNEKQLLVTYFLGGLSGAAFYILAYNFFPAFVADRKVSEMMGASAAVSAIIIGISAYAPNYAVYIPMIGPVKIKYLALIFFLLDFIRVASDNAGGYIAHIGGASYGFIFALQLQKGKDIGNFFVRFIDALSGIFKKHSRMKVSYKSQSKSNNDMEYNQLKKVRQIEIDRILDKIAKSGYDSLNKKEKETLFKMSNNS